MSEKIPLRKIRSFVKRDGRMTDSQKDALTRLWPQYGLNKDAGEINFFNVFNREAPRIFEIGFGSGQSLLEMAKLHPEEDYIGVEMYLPGIGALLLGLEKEKLNNVRIYYADAVEVMANCIPSESLDIVQIFFPDPWRKRKHHKRRLIQDEFLRIVATKLKAQGKLHIATDWEDYAKEMLKVLNNSEEFVNLAGHGNFAQRSEQRPIITKFEGRGERAGRSIRELQFAKA